MKARIPEFTAETRDCIREAKTLAEAEGAVRLSGVHVVRAACALFPETVAAALGLDGVQVAEIAPAASRSGDDSVTEIRKRPSKSLAIALDLLAAAGSPVPLAELLEAIQRHPCTRLEQLLARVATKPVGGARGSGVEPTYAAAADHLRDVRRLWILRTARLDGGGLLASRCADPESDRQIDGLAAAIERRSRPPARLVPTCGFTGLQRQLIECLVVNEIYGLERHPDGLEIRRFARLLFGEPAWLRNLASVREAVAELEGLDIIEREGACGDPRPSDRIRATVPVVDDVVEAVQRDPITRAEVRAFRRSLDTIGGLGEEEAYLG